MHIDELTASLKELHLSGFLEHYTDHASLAAQKNWSYEEFLLKLLKAEIEVRRQKRIARLKREAKLPISKSLQAYDFSGVSGITAQQVKKLQTGDFVRSGENVVFYGSFGLGKTHLAIGLIEELCEQNFRCLFITTNALIEQLLEAKQDLKLSDLWKKLDRFDLIACDELGYIPQSQEGADLFFQFISQRYERKSLIITTNLTYSEWGKVFLNETTTAAAVDRVIHRCKTFSLKGPSHRLKNARQEVDTEGTGH